MGGGAGQRSFTFCCEPSQYRELERFVNNTHAGAGLTMQVVTQTVTAEGETIGGSTSSGLAAPQMQSGQGGQAAELANAVRPPTAVPASDSSKFEPPPRADEAKPAPQESKKNAAEEQPKKKPASRCSACNTEFEDPAEYRKHCKCEWHNFNLRRKVKSLPPVAEEEYAEIALDIREGFLGVDS